MTRIALALIFALIPYPISADTITLEVLGEDRAVLTYYNHCCPANSSGGWHTLEVDGLRVSYGVEVQTDETLTVNPPEGWIALPDQVIVADGETVEVILIRGTYYGG